MAYRECVRHLWNSYFLRVNWVESEWDYREYFDDISRRLFEQTVVKQVSEGSSVEQTSTGFYPTIRVVPCLGPLGLEALWGKAQGTTTEWQVIQLKSAEHEFHFIDFFDWTVERTMDHQYCRVRLTKSQELAAYLGCDFLLESPHVQFFTSS
ncbi:hypothetical protein [Hymenobacter sp. HDW8]|uniref:hypothetical protein n=1 Tax=Hymenobacter sp. HDW8 TaxID=2714932 RepID=UPI00140E1494|nr:hypothetical protein [Hymenobacter sp. HDW8]QIL78357.1 hypothetical protein G7064_21315 [Hymenobacter sp. HDW8]